MNEISGVLYINKPAGITSYGVVNIIRKNYNLTQVGHTGTLDPMATGVMVLLIGRAVKASEYIINKDKVYESGLKLGIVTDTGDITGKVINETRGNIPELTPEKMTELAEMFTGGISQTPPMYSAKKINGRKLADLARKGITIDREPQNVNIYELKISRAADAEYSLYVHCSKGTYIRVLCEDIGAALGCGATMTALKRIRSGSVNISECYDLRDIEAMELKEKTGLLRPVDTLFDDLEAVELPEFYSKLAGNGVEIYQEKINTNFPYGKMVKLYSNKTFFALAQAREYENGSALKPVKQFNI